MAITVVNIIPNSMSGETDRDSEPDITVNPVNPLGIAASAFGPFVGPSPSPIFISTDGGTTWSQNFLLPGGSKTGDTSMRFGGNTGALYIGILRSDNAHLNILRTNDFAGPGPMDTLIDRANDDQPFVQAATKMGGGSGVGSDHVYIGNNDTSQRLTTGRTATVDFSLDAATAAAPAGFTTPARIEVRATADLGGGLGNQDGPSVRCAIHLDGTVYTAYFGWRTFASPNISDVVVVRDNDWASGPTPFTNLLDSGDGLAGQIVTAGVQIASLSTMLGTQRIGSQMSLAVDPRDSQTVYLAWCDGATGAAYTVHVRRSSDGGQTWNGDLRTITTATNCALAISSHGKVGLLYQQLGNPGTGNRWRTHFEMSSDGFATAPTDLLLADVADENGAYGGNNPIGDYANVVALGKDFYGIFSGNNTPDNANFPNAVIYQRNANFTTHQLLNTDGVTPVGVSIDPFFFHWKEVVPNKEFYLRDWTNDAADHDIGQEPSTYPWFYQKSDVWNRNTKTPGPIVDDWYAGDDPNAGSGAAGDNYAFARINRNDAGTKESVDIEFLSSDYGLGIPYSSVGNQTIKFAKGDLSKITKEQPWHLDPSASTHACLAAQINTADDPLILPGLSGNVPGWPFPDLLVINDNNKAQRNLDVNHVVTAMDGITIMRIRNAALHTRDMCIRYDIPKIKWPIPRSRVEVTGGESKAVKSGGSINLKRMKPGENRWITFAFESVRAGKRTEIPFNFYEMNGIRVVNGCAALLKSASIDEVVRSVLKLQQSVLVRLKAIGIKIGFEVINLSSRLLKSKSVKKDYLKNCSLFHDALAEAAEPFLSSANNKTMSIEKELKLFSSVSSNTLIKALSAHSIFLKKLDCLITMKLLAEGDLACILSNINWQISLFRTHDQLLRMKSTEEMLKSAERFTSRYPLGKVTNKDYPDLIKNSLNCFREATSVISEISGSLRDQLSEIEGTMGSLRSLQKVHYDFLLQISDYFER
jgi:hypothetical protein